MTDEQRMWELLVETMKDLADAIEAVKDIPGTAMDKHRAKLCNISNRLEREIMKGAAS